jgi:hypothetical protein
VRTQSWALAVGEGPNTAAVVTTKRAKNKETGEILRLRIFVMLP